MRFERLTSPQHPLYKRAMALYADSFPPHEQRENASQLRILGDEAYRFNLIYDENTFVGLALCWRTGCRGFWKSTRRWTLFPSAAGAFISAAALWKIPICMCIRPTMRAMPATRWLS